MSFFGSIVDKIVHYAEAAVDPSAAASPPAEAAGTVTATAATPSVPTAAAVSPGAAPAATAGTVTPAATGSAAPLASVDVGAVLSALAAKKGGGLNWQSSIVDLLKLLDLDSSLQARKTLATELDVHAGADGSAEENVALHKAVVDKLAENGGKIPSDMKG